MAQTARYANRRQQNGNKTTVRSRMYVDGNTVRKYQESPRGRQRQKSASRTKQPVSRAAQRNRAKAMNMTRSFVVFLTIVLIAILFSCVNYLHTKSQITAQMQSVADLESELNQIKEENDAYYSQVMSSVDLTAIKEKAVNELGMKYPSEDQVITYQTERSSYVRQYQDVPQTE